MNVYEAATEACKRKTLADALAYMALWETERIVRQARTNETWESCFGFCFKILLEKKRGTTNDI